MTLTSIGRGWRGAAILALAGAALSAGLSGCVRRGDAAEKPAPPAVVEQVPGSELSQVTLSREAAGRLDVRTAPVRREAGARVVPFGALLYDADGHAWVYTVRSELTYLRAAVVVDRVQGDEAYLTDGPPAGTAVVTVGVPELYGAEYGVEGE
jgi:hypothetical protein